MPISLAELEEARRPLEDRILDFLKRNPEQAYTVMELLGEMEGVNQSTLSLMTAFWTPTERQQALAPFFGALSALEKRNLIVSGKRGGSSYWAFARPKKIAP